MVSLKTKHWKKVYSLWKSFPLGFKTVPTSTDKFCEPVWRESMRRHFSSIFFLTLYNLLSITKETELSPLTLQQVPAAALQSSDASLMTSSTDYIVTSQELHRFSWNRWQKYELGGRGMFLSERPVYDKFCCSQVFRENKVLALSFESHNAHNKQVNLSKESWTWKRKGNCIVKVSPEIPV